MTESSKLVVVIAAGGTAGHIRPALAVGEALRARGATVTFAGSPDRVESRLVPEAGFELDTFAISGFPRKVHSRGGRYARRTEARGRPTGKGVPRFCGSRSSLLSSREGRGLQSFRNA